MTQLQGADISDYQGQPDFEKVKEEVAFVLTKATEGVGFTAQSLNRNKEEMRRVGLQHGFYHFARGGDPIAEANYFVDRISDYRKGELLMLDWEIEHDNPALWCLQWLQHVEARTGTKPLIYMNSNAAHFSDWSPVVQNNNGLMIASYGKNDGSPHNGPDSAQWPFWAIWQYTDRGTVNGIVGNVDLDIFNGDATMLARYGGAELALDSLQPVAAHVHAFAAANGSRSYTVQPGDSMGSIAGRFGVSLSALEAANPQIPNPNRIYPGEILHIPNGNQPPFSPGSGKQEILEQIKPILEKYDVPLLLVSAIIQVESSWNPRALGDGGTSFGLFQLHIGGQAEDAFRDGYHIEDLYHPKINAQYAMRSIGHAWDTLKGWFDPANGDWWIAFAIASGHPGGSHNDPATMNEARALQTAYAALNRSQDNLRPLLESPTIGERAEFAEADGKKIDLSNPWVSTYFTQVSTNPPRWQCKTTGKSLFAGILYGWQRMNGTPRLPISDEVRCGKKAIYQKCESGIILYDPDKEVDAPNGPWAPCYLLKLESPLAKKLLGTESPTLAGSTK